MDHLLSKTVKNIKISAIREIGNKVANDPSIINFTIGQPDFVTPDSILEAGKRAIEARKTGYTHNAGVLELRQAASDFVKRRYQLNYRPEDEILITMGASEALDIAFRTILEPGDEVILPAPVYPGYEPLIRMCYATPVFVDTRNNNCKISAKLIEENLSEKTKCVVLPYPSNPTGSILKAKELEEIANLLRGKDIFIISDEIYSELTYGLKHISIASFPEIKEKCIVINGLSKSHAMTGWRIGYTLAPAYITDEMFKVHAYNCVCASSVSQYAAIEALNHDLPEVEDMRKQYEKRRNYVYQRITDMGLETIKPDGAFYLFAITLSGAGSFDSVATIISYKWQYVAGPQSFGISDSSKSSVHIDHLVVGRYVFSLTVKNSEGGVATDTFSFLVKPDSLPVQKKPVAIIQGDTLVTLPADSVRLTGLSSYDLSGNIRKYLWRFISGPSVISIADSLSPSITLRNLNTGIYTISLTVTNDIGRIAQDTFRFDVSRSYITNPPVAVISGSATIVLPVNALSLDGRYSYSAGDSITSYEWRYVSGPAGFSVSDTTLSALTIKNLSEGAYVFKLIVHNSHGVSGMDSVSFLVLRKQGGGNTGIPSLQIVTRPGLTLAPVPVNSYLGVYLNDSTLGKISVRIVDMNGRIVVRKQDEAKVTARWKTMMNVANLASGSYFVEVTVGKESFRGRFIK